MLIVNIAPTVGTSEIQFKLRAGCRLGWVIRLVNDLEPIGDTQTSDGTTQVSVPRAFLESLSRSLAGKGDSSDGVSGPRHNLDHWNSCQRSALSSFSPTVAEVLTPRVSGGSRQIQT